MKRFSEQFKKQADAIGLKASERTELKARLISYMEYHPLPKGMAMEVSAKKQKGITSEPFFTFTFNKLYVQSFAGVFALFLILSIPVAAEQAIPGDVLYPVKVQFTEELRSTLSFTPYAKVAWETERVERRISEARLLASEGKLTTDAQNQFAEAIKTHTDTAQREIALLKESDSDEAAVASIAFASALAVQSQVLEGHIENDVVTDQHDTSILAVAEVVAQARTSAEATQNAAQPSYEKLLATVELESTRVYELFATVKKSASAEEVTDVERRLADLDRKVTQAIARKEGTVLEDPTEIATLAIAKIATTATTSGPLVAADTTNIQSDETLAFSSGAAPADTLAPVSMPATQETEAEAVGMLRTTLTDIQKLLNYLTHIDVRESVSIEELLPIVPTTQERALAVQTLFDETRALQAKTEAHVLSGKLVSKISHRQNEIDKKLATATSLMQKGAIDEAYAITKEAHAIATDLVSLTAHEPMKTIEVEAITSTTTKSIVTPE